ncbi:MAG: alpha-L-fucosidase [Planctomycetota bacterium]
MKKKKYPHGDYTWFVRDRFGMFIHWGTYALGGRGEWVKNRERITNEEYQKYFDNFYPDLYNPKEWARLAKQAGMKYFVITTKHHEGFCLWDSQYTDYKATNTLFKKDLLTPIIEAFREEGIKVGFYYSLLDWHHPEFTIDKHHPQRDDKDFRKKEAKRDMRKYCEYMHKQIKELLTKFGKIDILWCDYSYPGEDGKGRDEWQSEKLVEMIRKLQPDILLNNRLDLPESADFYTPEQYLPHQQVKNSEGAPVIWEGCQTFCAWWGYYRDESNWKSLEMLIQILVESVSKNGNLLLNVGPTGRGNLDSRVVKSLEGIGRWMKYHNRSIYDCGAAPEAFTPPQDCRYTYNADTNRLYLHLFALPFKTLHLPSLEGKVKYVQFLHDASEIKFRDASMKVYEILNDKTPAGCVTLEIPASKPNVTIPVIEIFLK